MGMITDINKLKVSNKNDLLYDDKKIGKCWGKTLFHIDKQGNLHYQNFSPIGLLFRLCGFYKKEYNSESLSQWLTSKEINIRHLADSDKITEKTALQALKVLAD